MKFIITNSVEIETMWRRIQENNPILSVSDVPNWCFSKLAEDLKADEENTWKTVFALKPHKESSNQLSGGIPATKACIIEDNVFEAVAESFKAQTLLPVKKIRLAYLTKLALTYSEDKLLNPSLKEDNKIVDQDHTGKDNLTLLLIRQVLKLAEIEDADSLKELSCFLEKRFSEKSQ